MLGNFLSGLLFLWKTRIFYGSKMSYTIFWQKFMTRWSVFKFLQKIVVIKLFFVRKIGIFPFFPNFKTELLSRVVINPDIVLCSPWQIAVERVNLFSEHCVADAHSEYLLCFKIIQMARLGLKSSLSFQSRFPWILLFVIACNGLLYTSNYWLILLIETKNFQSMYFEFFWNISYYFFTSCKLKPDLWWLAEAISFYYCFIHSQPEVRSPPPPLSIVHSLFAIILFSLIQKMTRTSYTSDLALYCIGTQLRSQYLVYCREDFSLCCSLTWEILKFNIPFCKQNIKPVK